MKKNRWFGKENSSIEEPQGLGVESIATDPLTLAPVKAGTAIEIVTCGSQVFKGSWERPDATRDAFVEIGGRRDLRAGDPGYVDDDGNFFMIDRLKRIINV